MAYLQTPCVYKLPQPIYPDEVFVNASYAAIPEGLNHHKVSNYSRVYDYRKEQFCNLHKDSKGYLYIIAAANGLKKNIRVHRIVLASFNYVPGCENSYIFLVNHKDGDKTNNCLYNLEWTDYSGNIKHAYNTGLINNKQGEDRVNSKITNNQAEEICKMLQSGITITEVANITSISRDIVQSIYNHRAWNSISCNYAFPENNNSILTDENIVNICELLATMCKSDDISYNEYYRNILSICNLPIDMNYVEAVRHIHRGKTHKNISCNYNFD